MPLCPFCRMEMPYQARFCPHCTQNRFDFVPPEVAGPNHDLVAGLGMFLAVAVGFWLGFSLWQIVGLAVIGAIVSHKVSRIVFGD